MTERDLQYLKDELAEVKSIALDTHKKICVGNGKDSILVQLDRLNVFKNVSMWILSATTIASMSLMVKLIYDIVSKQG